MSSDTRELDCLVKAKKIKDCRCINQVTCVAYELGEWFSTSFMLSCLLKAWLLPCSALLSSKPAVVFRGCSTPQCSSHI